MGHREAHGAAQREDVHPSKRKHYLSHSRGLMMGAHTDNVGLYISASLTLTPDVNATGLSVCSVERQLLMENIEPGGTTPTHSLVWP